MLRCVGERFFRQGLENGGILEKELATGPEAGGSEAREAKVFRQFWDQLFAVSGTVRTILLKLEDPGTNDPVANGEGAIGHGRHTFSQ